MGNCQAAEAATVIIQHPGGKVERLYWPTSAADVMKSNPGHYVALVILFLSDKEKKHEGSTDSGSARVTRVKLLKPKDVLLLGQVYRLITSQEVTKALQARKFDKMKKMQNELGHEKQESKETHRNHRDKHSVVQKSHGNAHSDQVIKQEKDHKHRSSGTSGASIQSTNRSRHWRPSLHSISEAMS
ncbi:D-ribose-binding periplasmic protein [Rhynchospora pubera]|uniref:D-ribose-binding periplasmic protein n=1 Tax=Rhynchospora pubera TaxID=906938 RepID=A0AAV8G8X4_9POAL|nr:D-ribose-binding periplasmic protein [Rhynchospora pubera]